MALLYVYISLQGWYYMQNNLTLMGWFFIHIFVSLVIFSFLPSILAIHTHIHKRKKERTFHLFYIIFSSPAMFSLFVLMLRSKIDFLVFLTLCILILCLPTLFVLKNFYLSKREKTKNT